MSRTSAASLKNLIPAMPLSDDIPVQEVATLKQRAPELVEVFGPNRVGELREYFGGMRISDIGLLRQSERAAILGAAHYTDREGLAARGAQMAAAFTLGAEGAAEARARTIEDLMGLTTQIKRDLTKHHADHSSGNDLQNPWVWEGVQLSNDARDAAERLGSAKGTDQKIIAQSGANYIIFAERYSAWREHKPAPEFNLANIDLSSKTSTALVLAPSHALVPVAKAEVPAQKAKVEEARPEASAPAPKPVEKGFWAGVKRGFAAIGHGIMWVLRGIDRFLDQR
jgi:hypothetical protein